VLNQMTRTRPQTYFSLSGGGLGFSGGAALGAKRSRGRQRGGADSSGDGQFSFLARRRCMRSPDADANIIGGVRRHNGGWQAVKEGCCGYNLKDRRSRQTSQARSVARAGLSSRSRLAFRRGMRKPVADPAALGPSIRRLPPSVGKRPGGGWSERTLTALRSRKKRLKTNGIAAAHRRHCPAVLGATAGSRQDNFPPSHCASSSVTSRGAARHHRAGDAGKMAEGVGQQHHH